MNGTRITAMVSEPLSSFTMVARRATSAPAVRSLRRPITLGLVTILATMGCATENPLSPERPAMNLAVSAQTVTTEAVNVGDNIVLWSPAYFPPESKFDLIVAGASEFEGDRGCPRGSYRVNAMSPSNTQEGPRAGGSWQWYSSQALARGTRLRFVGYVSNCDGGWNAWEFEVITAPGK